MTDNDPSRGLDQVNWTGIAYNPVVQPNHVEAVIARMEDGHIWKLVRYFDNPRFWSTPPARLRGAGRHLHLPLPGDGQIDARTGRIRDVRRFRRPHGAAQPRR